MDAAIEEDAQGVAVSSYQGGHVEYFEYLVESLKARGADHVHVVGGGGGVIVHDEIERLRSSGVTIFSPEDGQRMGLPGMINCVVAATSTSTCGTSSRSPPTTSSAATGSPSRGRSPGSSRAGSRRTRWTPSRRPRPTTQVPVLGITGTGGSGKSSLTDELVRRFRVDQQDKLRIAVVAVDPTRRKGGGALLGDRIRMNSLSTATAPTSGHSPPAARTSCPTTSAT